jgi:4'-phosphopantetheinyl transferase EntD
VSSPDLVAVAATLRGLAPPGVRTGCRVISEQDVAGMFPAEADHVRGAVSARRHEFASGRALLRELLGVGAPIGVRADRAPALPAGFVGSLAHDRSLAVAAVAPAGVVAALGIDVEAADALEEDVAAAVLRPDETGIDAHLAFTLKEAVYKAWSTGGGRILDHHDVRLSVGAEGRFEGVVADGAVLGGRFGLAGDRWLALVAVPSRADGAARWGAG